MSIKTHDAKGNLISEEDYGDDGRLIWKKKFDKKGKVIELKEYTSGGHIDDVYISPSKKKYIYKYDREGNLIEKKYQKPLIERIISFKKEILYFFLFIYLCIPPVIIYSNFQTKNLFVLFAITLAYFTTSYILVFLIIQFSGILYFMLKKGIFDWSESFDIDKLLERELFLAILIMWNFLNILVSILIFL